MQTSLPARPSLEQLKKLAKDLVRHHEEKQPEALAQIARHLPVLTGKSADEVAVYPLALHDAQSVIARRYGFPAWRDLHEYLEQLPKEGAAPVPELDIVAKLHTALRARKIKDYALFCSVMSPEMKAGVSEERFLNGGERMSAFLDSDYRLTYMGDLKRGGRLVHFWRLWVPGWETDLLVRMSINPAGEIAGLLYSDPFDTAINARR